MSDNETRLAGALARLYLLVLVTVTGGVVLAIEVLGTRVIGTYYGSSLYVWAALLSVTLVCLAIGYAVGGRLADRFPHGWMLHLLVVLAGASVLLAQPMTGVLAPFSDWFGFAWGAIASALVIFFLPLTLLATAGPYVIRLRARTISRVGSTSGAVYALSTIGSVAGVLIVVFWAIPSLGTRGSLLACSGALIALGGFGLAIASRGKALPVILLAGLPLLVRPREAPVPGQLHHAESAYGELRVVQQDRSDRGPYRMLLVNGIMQTGMPLDIGLVGPGSILQTDSYYLELLPYFHPDLGDGRRGVLIGLAGGMFPRVMEFYGIDWTAVEIDVNVAELARAYFGYLGRISFPGGRVHEDDLSRFDNRHLPPMHDYEGGGMPEDRGDDGPAGAYTGRAVIQDGRQYLLQNPAPADFIVVDAYSSDTIPFHLITREFFDLVKNRLTGDGILAINYIGRPESDFVTDSLFRTLGDVFGDRMLLAYRTHAERGQVQVIVIFAFRRKMELYPLWHEDDPAGGADRLSYELAHRTVRTDGREGVVITDDLNPIDRARAETALEWRRRTMEALK